MRYRIHVLKQAVTDHSFYCQRISQVGAQSAQKSSPPNVIYYYTKKQKQSPQLLSTCAIDALGTDGSLA